MTISFSRQLLIIVLLVVSMVKLADVFLSYHRDPIKKADTEQQQSADSAEETETPYKVNDDNAEIIAHRHELRFQENVQKYHRHAVRMFFPSCFFTVPTPPPRAIAA